MIKCGAMRDSAPGIRVCQPRRSFPIPPIVVAVVLAATGLGCEGVFGPPEDRTELLPGPPKEGVRFAETQPANAYLPLVRGIAQRTVFEVTSPEGIAVSIRELVIGPKQTTEPFKFASGMMIAVIAGSGELTIGERRVLLELGSGFTIPPGESVRIVNDNDQALTMRGYLIGGE